MKYPLNLYIVWHPNFTHGNVIAEQIYSTFCRDFENPLSRGLGIPVYFRNQIYEDSQPLSINLSNAEKNAIVLLIDSNYFLDENFKNYTRNLASQIDNNNRIYPISLFHKAYSIGCNLSNLQFTDATTFFGRKLDLSIKDDLKCCINKIKTELLHDTSRLLLNFHPAHEDKDEDRIGSPVKLFLSHAKKDGEVTTINFKQFIENNLKLDVFFDTVDIANGYDFAKQFEKEIKQSALVVFHTDEYSNREWCRREILIAKKHKSPIVVAHNLKKGEKRAFPYMGNMPTTVLVEEENEDFYRIVFLTLYQVLNNLYQFRLLSNYKNLINWGNTEVKILTSPPELFNFLDIKKYKEESENKLIILYPDPPLGTEEITILNELDDSVSFVTPINLN